jgi:hypothetical protein
MAEYRRRCEAGVTLEDGRDVALANARTFDRAAGRDQLGGSTYAQARRKSAVGAPGARLPSTKSSMKPETCNHAPAAVSGRSSEPTKLLLPDMSTSVAPTSRIPVRTRMQGRLGRDPRDLVFANLGHLPQADSVEVRASAPALPAGRDHTGPLPSGGRRASSTCPQSRRSGHAGSARR